MDAPFKQASWTMHEWNFGYFTSGWMQENHGDPTPYITLLLITPSAFQQVSSHLKPSNDPYTNISHHAPDVALTQSRNRAICLRGLDPDHAIVK